MNQAARKPATAAPAGGSLFAATLANAAPTLTRPPPSSAVRHHTLDGAASPAQRSSSTPGLKAVPGKVKPGGGGSSGQQPPPTTRREFNEADKAIIRRVHAYMAPAQLLGILNERLVCDQGGDVERFTLDQLRAEIASVVTAVPADGNDWASMRKILAKARRSGVLDMITDEVINNFAVVFSLNAKQVMHLKDTLLQTDEEDDE